MVHFTLSMEHLYIRLNLSLFRRRPTIKSNTLSQKKTYEDRLHFYREMIYWMPGRKIQYTSRRSTNKMPRQHQSKTMKQVFKELERLGFNVIHKKSGSYSIYPPSTIQGPMYTTHGTESAIHPMRRDFKRLYNVELTV